MMMKCAHDYVPITRRGIVPTKGKLAGMNRCKQCGDTIRRIEPDMIVRNVINGKLFKVRSVTKTKAICQPMMKTRTWQGFETLQSNLEIVRTR